jgi:hypothetical protein
VAKPKIAERIDGQLAVEPSTPSYQIADPRGEREAASDRHALRSLVLSIGTVLTISLPWPPAADGQR